MSINSCVISGNLTRDAELRSTKGGSQILTFSVAVNDRRKNSQSGEWEDVPNFIDCCLFGPRAEKLSSMLSKGTKVCVFGKLRWSQWESNGQKRSKIEVIADDIELMTRSKAQNQGQQSAQNSDSQRSRGGYYPQSQAPDSDSYNADVYDADIPF